MVMSELEVWSSRLKISQFLSTIWLYYSIGGKSSRGAHVIFYLFWTQSSNTLFLNMNFIGWMQLVVSKQKCGQLIINGASLYVYNSDVSVYEEVADLILHDIMEYWKVKKLYFFSSCVSWHQQVHIYFVLNNVFFKLAAQCFKLSILFANVSDVEY